jgi:hypothetical protein
MALDYSKLDDEQLANAAKVAAAAQKYGINPDFVMPMVMAESGFRHIKNPNSNAFGIMQLMPATAKGLKVDSADIDENIDGGMRLLKELSSNPKIGNDPYKILAGYNASPTTLFLSSGDLKDLPEETVNHMAKVASFYGGELPSNPITESVGEEPPEAPALPGGQTGKPVVEQKVEPTQLNPLLGAAIGAKAGAATGTAAALVDAKFNAASGLQEAFDYLRGRSAPITALSDVAPAVVSEPVAAPARPGAAPAAAAVSPKYGGENWTKALTGVDIPDAQMGKEDLDAAKGMKKAVGRNGAPGFTGGTITKGGVIISPQDAAALANKAGQLSQAEQLAENAKLIRQAQARIALQKLEQSKAAEAAMLARVPTTAAATSVPESTSPLWNYTKRLAGFPLKGALAGAGAGFSAVDVYNRLKQGDNTGALLSGLGGTAGLAGTFMGSMGALPAAAIALPLYNTASDRIEYLKKHPEEQQLVTDRTDAMGNPY